MGREASIGKGGQTEEHLRLTLGLIYMRRGNTYESQRVIVSPRESEGVIHEGLRVRYSMTHKESDRCSKHNDDVEIVVGSTRVRPYKHEKWEQKGKRYTRTRMLVTLPLSYPGATL